MTAGTGALLLAIGGGAAGIATLTRDDKPAERVVTTVGQAAGSGAGPAAPAPAGNEPHAPVPPPKVATKLDPATGGAAAGGTAAGGTAAGGTAAGGAAAGGTAAGGTAAGGAAAGGTAAGARGSRLADQADRTATRTPRDPGAASPARGGAPGAAATTPAGGPAPTTRTEVETREIPFRTRLVRDPNLPRGSKRVQSEGVPGLETLRYLVILTDGRPAERRLIDARVTREPQHRVIAFGGGRHIIGRGPECGRGLRLCVPLGRPERCPRTVDQAGSKAGATVPEESALLLGDDSVVLDEGVDLLDLDGMGCPHLPAYGTGGDKDVTPDEKMTRRK